MSVFDQIKQGLEEAIAYEQGKVEVPTKTMSISSLPEYDAKKVKEIRAKTGMTQRFFAEFMGVSVKTVEAWESGRNKPAGSACRLLSFADKDPLFPQKTGIVTHT